MSNFIDPTTGVRYQPVRKSYSADRQKDYRNRQKWKGRVCANWWLDEKLCREFLYAARDARSRDKGDRMDVVNFMLAWALERWEKECSKLKAEVEATGLSDNPVADASRILRDAMRQAIQRWAEQKRSQRSER